MILKNNFSFHYLIGHKLLVLATFVFSFGVYAQGYQIPDKPKLQTSVYDYVNLLTSNQKQHLESKLIRYSDTTSTQIVVAIIASTEGEEIKYLAAQWGEKWGIGKAGKDNGILILLAKDDKKITLEVGKGIEPLLTDLQSKRIIERIIIPEFKKGDFYNGLDKGANYVFKTLIGEFKETAKQKSEKFKPGILFLIIIVFIFVIIISRRNKNNRGGGKHYKRGSIADNLLNIIILSNIGRSSGSGSFGGSSGGGGFSGGFGGGSFGGGGASGGW